MWLDVDQEGSRRILGQGSDQIGQYCKLTTI